MDDLGTEWDDEAFGRFDEEDRARVLIDTADVYPGERDEMLYYLDQSGTELEAFRNDGAIDFGTRICGYEPNELQKQYGLNWFTDQQKEIDDECNTNRNVIVFSGNGIGKTNFLGLK